MALEELECEEKVKIAESWIDANHHVVEKRIEKLYRKVSGIPKRGNAKRSGYVFSAGETLLKQYKKFLSDSFEPVDLASKHSNAGHRVKDLPQWTIDLMVEAIQPFLDKREPYIIRSFEKLQAMLQEANQELSLTEPDHTDIAVSRTNSRTKFYKFAKSLGPTAVKISRKGWDEMARLMRSGFGELKARMIAEAIQIDECQMPLRTFLNMTGFDKVVGDRTIRQLKKEAQDGEVVKIWFLVTVDVATGAPLAFHLAKNPNSDDTLELLRRLVSDKTQLAREAGCESDPPPAVRPFMIMMYTGSGL